MKDANGNNVVNGILICSGNHAYKGCNNAVDMVYPWWRPQCLQCEINEAWIGYKVSKEIVVVEAYAKGLGIGSVGSYSWNGGVVLQRSEDAGKTWEDIGYTGNSDSYLLTNEQYIVMDEWTNWCANGFEVMTSSTECERYADTQGLMFQGSIDIGPKGCYIEHGKYVLYNTHIQGSASKYRTPVCKASFPSTIVPPSIISVSDTTETNYFAIVLPTVAGVVLFCCFWGLVSERWNLNDDDPIHNTPAIDGNNDNDVIDEHLSTAQQRFRIEQQLIIRKVLPETNYSTRSAASHNNTNESHSISSGDTSSRQLDDEASLDQMDMAHASIFSSHTRKNRSVQLSDRLNVVRDPMSCPQSENEIDDFKLKQYISSTNASKRQSHPKANIFVRFISKSFRSNDESENSCGICLMDYKVGDEVAFSPNEECTHGFHTNCIVDWLIDNNSCPMCRQDYLGVHDADRNIQSQTSPSSSNMPPP